MSVVASSARMSVHRAGEFILKFPESSKGRSQDEECFEVERDGDSRKLRVHDYDVLYDTPGLYEALVYEALGCKSPDRITHLLAEVLKDWPTNPAGLCVLDLGAGNGIAAEHLRRIGVEEIVGLDILPEAAAAAERDRPGVYDDYLVADLRKLTEAEVKRLGGRSFNCLITVAALGFGDIPPDAFATAFNFIQDDGWIAMTIKEDFLTGADDSGFARMLRMMVNEGIIELQAHHRYCHRRSLAGDRLFYLAIVGRKAKDIPASLVKRCQEPAEVSVQLNGDKYLSALFGD